MSDVVPLIHQQELDLLKMEIGGAYLSVIFDGTTRFGEAMAILVRFIDNEFCVQQRLIRVQLVSKSMTGEEVARELISCLSVTFSIRSELLIGSMHDRASVNNVAMSTLKVVYPSLFDIGCFSHTLDHVGEKFVTPIVSEFAAAWISLFSHSSKAKLAWRDQTSISMKTHSSTRWWSKFEVNKQVFDLFGDVELFLRQHTDLAPATRSKLLAFFDDPTKKMYLQLELATLVDGALPFVQSTYKLEGNRALAFECYDIISSLTAAVHVAHYPNVKVVCQKLSQGNVSLQQQLLLHSQKCLQPGYDYYLLHLNGCLMVVPLAAFKAARLFVPQRVHELQPELPDSSTVDSLAVFPFLDSQTTLDALKRELPQYVACSEDLSLDCDVLPWWKAKRTDLPTWAVSVKKVLCLQPSSAAAERVFSLLQVMFNDRQGLALQDYIESSLMLQYNGR